MQPLAGTPIRALFFRFRGRRRALTRARPGPWESGVYAAGDAVDAQGEGQAVGDVQFFEYGRQVRTHGALADAHAFGDGLVAVAQGDVAGDLLLARGQARGPVGCNGHALADLVDHAAEHAVADPDFAVRDVMQDLFDAGHGHVGVDVADG